MFNVSALLLDDALKPATPLTNGAINELLTFHKVVQRNCAKFLGDPVCCLTFRLMSVIPLYDAGIFRFPIRVKVS